jgi:hypothetical protein
MSHESSRDQYGRRHRALQRHVRAGSGDAHDQSRRRSERPRAKPRRALCVQSVRVPVATELLPPERLLRLWSRPLWGKLLRLRLRTKLPVLPVKRIVPEA